MKTLVIHPKDKSTTFLEIVYKKLKDATVITGGYSRVELIEMIPKYDRVMIMGHGSPEGLFRVGTWKDRDGYYIINKGFVDVLKDNPNNIYIWCNASQFVEKHKLKGFYTGMFISETVEALYMGLYMVYDKDVDESNMEFVKIVGRNINNKSSVIHKRVKKYYSRLAEVNPVAVYNNNRLYLAE